LSFQIELRKLNIKIRNKVRVLISLAPQEATSRLDSIRNTATAAELAQIERALYAFSEGDDPLIPSLFPSTPQTFENFHRLSAISLDTQIELIEIHARANKGRLLAYCAEIAKLNKLIVQASFAQAAEQVGLISEVYGYSHHLLRKAVLIRALAPADQTFVQIEDLLLACGSGKNNVIVTSLMHCFQEEQDYLSQKRSILNLPNRGLSNKFTRDISRLAFHPQSDDRDEVRDHLQSAAQSSLIDAIIYVRVNKQTIDEAAIPPTIKEISQALSASSPLVDEIVTLYDVAESDSEHLFFKHSSAWLENSEILRYRRFLDNFYDDPEASYIRRTPSLIEEISPWVGSLELNDLVNSTRLTGHEHKVLNSAEV